jgi:hypothetical protein
VQTLIFVAAIVLPLLATGADAAPESAPRPTGLEVSDASSVPVIIQELTGDAKERGLTRETIEARVNEVLRKNGLKPTDGLKDFQHDYNYDLTVSTKEAAVRIDTAFQRIVTYSDGITSHTIVAKTWNRGLTAVGLSTTEILDNISEATEVFANEFLKANRK